MRFDELDLHGSLLRAVTEMGFEEMTPIQAQAIPVVLSGKDIIGQAQTGTGKLRRLGCRFCRILTLRKRHCRQ